MIVGILKVTNHQVVDSDQVITIRINIHRVLAIVTVVVAAIQTTTVTIAVVIQTRMIADGVNTLIVAVVIMIVSFLVWIIIIENFHQIVMAVAIVTVVGMMTMIEKTIITVVIVVTEEIPTEIQINIPAESIIKIPVDGMNTIIVELQNIHPIVVKVVRKLVENKIIIVVGIIQAVPKHEQKMHQAESVVTLAAVVAVDINGIHFHHKGD